MLYVSSTPDIHSLNWATHSVIYRLSQRLFHKCVTAPTPPDISAHFPGHSRVLFCFRINAYASWSFPRQDSSVYAIGPQCSWFVTLMLNTFGWKCYVCGQMSGLWHSARSRFPSPSWHILHASSKSLPMHFSPCFINLDVYNMPICESVHPSIQSCRLIMMLRSFQTFVPLVLLLQTVASQQIWDIVSRRILCVIAYSRFTFS